MSCELCFTNSSFHVGRFELELCIACVDELSELVCYNEEAKAVEWSSNDQKSTAKIESLYRYNGIVRSLTISAKVKGDISALNRLLKIWDSELKADAFAGINAVMPCPSSLWSRVHGRVDIAWFLAARIAKKYQISFLRPPRALYWNLQKRSQKERPSETNLVVQKGTNKLDYIGNSQRHCLIIDDVVTTGKTLKTCIEYAAKLDFDRFSCLTFARAR
jgi:predicted amidophosphoribosyltransferase